MVLWIYKSEPVKVSYHPVTFGGYKHSGSRYVMVLVCHVISEDQVITRSCNFMGEGVLL